MSDGEPPIGGRSVLFVDHAGVLGGAELSLLDLAAAFGAGSETLLLAAGPFRAALESRGVKVSVESLGALRHVKKETRLPRPAAFTDAIRIARRVGRRARPHRMIYANSQKAFVVAAAAGLLARRPVVWHLRDILAPPHFSGTNVRAASCCSSPSNRLSLASTTWITRSRSALVSKASALSPQSSLSSKSSPSIWRTSTIRNLCWVLGLSNSGFMVSGSRPA